MPGEVPSQATREAPDVRSMEMPPRDKLRKCLSIVSTNVALSGIFVTIYEVVEFPRVEKIPGGETKAYEELVLDGSWANSGEMGMYRGIAITFLNVLTQVVSLRPVMKTRGIVEPATATRRASRGVSQLLRAMRARL